MKKILAVCVLLLLLLLSLLVAWWWKGTGEDPRLLRTIDARIIGDFGGVKGLSASDHHPVVLRTTIPVQKKWSTQYQDLIITPIKG